MKKTVILIWVWVMAFVSFADWAKVTTWVKNQNYTKAQIDAVTRDQLRTIAINRGIEDGSRQMKLIMSRYNMLKNDARADWRAKRIEAGRVILEAKVHEYDADGVVRYMGQEPSTGDPNIILSVYTVEIDLNLE